MTSVWPQLRATFAGVTAVDRSSCIDFIGARIVLVEEKIYPGNLSLKKSNFPAFFRYTQTRKSKSLTLKEGRVSILEVCPYPMNDWILLTE